MHLFRAPNCTYYTRICYPKSLRDMGFPFDVKISLLTKTRAIAKKRNLRVILAVNQAMDSITTETVPGEFKSSLNKQIDAVRLSFSDVSAEGVPLRFATKGKIEVRGPNLAVKQCEQVPLKLALEMFISSKSKEGVRTLTVQQLHQRISHFIDAIKPDFTDEVTSACALGYRDLLLDEGRSHKTNKDYLAASSQLFKWCCLMQFTDANPFALITLKQHSLVEPNSARTRWQKRDLQALFSHEEFQKAENDLKWATLLMMFQGLRPSEACQLRTADVIKQEGLYCIKINNGGEKQRVKNASSLRILPIHQFLLKHGFIELVERANKAKRVQLFSYIPTNQNEDWSRQYCQYFGRMQNRMGMKPGSRPTPYGFRHTFIDELKQHEVDENIVAELVGHKNQKITFGRYGKKYKISLLKKYVDVISYDIDCTRLF
ncbi:site-specific integrase [Shewanella canadensis]|uniref:Site-specific integrase n=2 Tax=Shewanella canadensis TaxID=271096 RepID=A0A3S0RVZ5_9GAMM|nr:site-specific integrase [Shewanella canadensis]